MSLLSNTVIFVDDTIGRRGRKIENENLFAPRKAQRVDGSRGRTQREEKRGQAFSDSEFAYNLSEFRHFR